MADPVDKPPILDYHRPASPVPARDWLAGASIAAPFVGWFSSPLVSFTLARTLGLDYVVRERITFVMCSLLVLFGLSTAALAVVRARRRASTQNQRGTVTAAFWGLALNVTAAVLMALILAIGKIK